MDELNSFEAATKDILVRERKAAAAARSRRWAGRLWTSWYVRQCTGDQAIRGEADRVSGRATSPAKARGYEPQGFGFGPPGGFGPGNQLARPLLQVLDADRDGNVSDVEFANGMKRLFSQWDVDKNGGLDQKEIADGLQKLMPAQKGPFGGPPGGMPPFGGPPGRPGNGPPPRPKMP